jgi:hypothetical protein
MENEKTLTWGQLLRKHIPPVVDLVCDVVDKLAVDPSTDPEAVKTATQAAEDAAMGKPQS